MGDRTLFFYGTLMSPAILHRVIHGPSNPTFPTPSSSYVRTCPAMLHSHRRHRVRSADYPAIVPDTASDACVRGTFATGLTDADVGRLDIFEGDEYERRFVKVRKLIIGKSAGAGQDQELEDGTQEEGEEAEVETYVWIAGKQRLEDDEWDFETFKKEKMRFWIGSDGTEGSTGREEFEAVDQADGTGGRSVNGSIGRQLEQHHRGGEAIGSAV
ncbi:AIG2-like protein [Sphaceloma murrayae]|uniref:Putative gamma-glutamylcyclotransferase n=1 Tax=Sphaceloma murrayae TaxID=2082308 RepID=A0A2K1QN30_9PEZI|nr:AIG2-like protein [Sphaceloma murrayae]